VSKVHTVRNEVTYLSTKTYGHEIGLSAVFRQWKANSHCNMLHGYSLAFRFVFETDELDYRNWVVDFGGLKGLKLALQHHFDHKTVVAQDDPHLTTILALQNMNIADVVIVPAVGCEKFAELAANLAKEELKALGIAERVRVVEVECFEHGANSAIYRP
jgi:6-pyruvoyltetrahydropterin/6-carboxytetrahydropterin synthase